MRMDEVVMTVVAPVPDTAPEPPAGVTGDSGEGGNDSGDQSD
jgi:hypothetical protein